MTTPLPVRKSACAVPATVLTANSASATFQLAECRLPVPKQLAEFKSGARVNPTMQGMVAALSDEDM